METKTMKGLDAGYKLWDIIITSHRAQGVAGLKLFDEAEERNQIVIEPNPEHGELGLDVIEMIKEAVVMSGGAYDNGWSSLYVSWPTVINVYGKDYRVVVAPGMVKVLDRPPDEDTSLALYKWAYLVDTVIEMMGELAVEHRLTYTTYTASIQLPFPV